MKTAIVTGATKGLGRSCCKQLGLKGYRVLLAARDLPRAKETLSQLQNDVPGGRFEVIDTPLDLSRAESVREFASAVLEKEKRIDVLLNNAGYFGRPNEEAYVSYPGFGRVGMLAQTNFLGPYHLTRLLETRLIESKARLVNMSSVAHRIANPTPFRRGDASEFLRNFKSGYYPATKLANVYFSFECQRLLGPLGVECVAVDPGAVDTDIWDTSPISEGPGRQFIHLTGSSPDDGAQILTYAASAPWDSMEPLGFLPGADPIARGQSRGAGNDLRFVARGMFGNPFLSNTGYEPSLNPLAVANNLVLFSNQSLTFLDTPLRKLLGSESMLGELFSKVHVVPASPQSYDEAASRRLWELASRVVGVPVEVQVPTGEPETTKDGSDGPRESATTALTKKSDTDKGAELAAMAAGAARVEDLSNGGPGSAAPVPLAPASDFGVYGSQDADREVAGPSTPRSTSTSRPAKKELARQGAMESADADAGLTAGESESVAEAETDSEPEEPRGTGEKQL